MSENILYRKINNEIIKNNNEIIKNNNKGNLNKIFKLSKNNKEYINHIYSKNGKITKYNIEYINYIKSKIKNLNKDDKNKINIIKTKINKQIEKERENKIEIVKKMNISRGFINKNNSVNNIRQRLSNSNRVNISKITRMINTIHKYFNVLDPSIEDIFKPVFDEFFRQNIKINQTKTRVLNIGNKQFELIPEFYNNRMNGNLQINKFNKSSGAYSNVYTNISLIKNSNKKKLNSTILKLIKDKSKEHQEFNSLIFNMCLLALLYFQNNNNKIKYFCDLYEFGKIKKINNFYYAIMENGGYELLNLDFNDKYNNILFHSIPYKIILNRLNIVLYIIKECAKAIQVLHNIYIIHCDIKPENFLYSIKDGKYYIKIIDFGFSKKNITYVNDLFGTYNYIPYDFYYTIINGLQYIITFKNDIYALGIILLILLLKALNTKNSRPIVNFTMQEKIKKGNINDLEQNMNQNIEYNIKVIISNLENIFDSLKDVMFGFMRKNIIKKKKDFIQNLNTILRKITYLDGNYNNLQEFINDIDDLIELLKKI